MRDISASVALAALAAIFITAPAVAADIEAAPPLPQTNWTAFHIGAGGGGTFAFADEDANATFDPENLLFQHGEHSGDLGDDSFFGTIEAGFDYQLGSSFVAGILANYDFNKTKMKNTSDAAMSYDGDPFADGSFETEYEVGDSWAIGGRLGFLAMDNALLYVMGGYTEASIKAESTLESNYHDLYHHTSESSWEDGWFVGGGIEALVTDNISLKAEYRYNDYGSVKNNNDDGVYTDNQEADITVHSVRAVLSYRFGL